MHTFQINFQDLYETEKDKQQSQNHKEGGQLYDDIIQQETQKRKRKLEKSKESKSKRSKDSFKF